MKFLVLFAAVCIGAAVAEVPIEEQVLHEQELTELCKERGVFANPHDPEGRTFIRCELEPVELRCDEEFIFDAEKLMCVEKPQPPAPVDLNAVNWAEVLTCPDVEDKYFRNPYDCSRFYRCYKQGPFSRMDANQCLPTMIFDEVLETCLPADQFRSYYGHSCENAPLPAKKEETQPEQPEETQPEQQEETQPEQPEETQPEQQEETQPEQPEETQPEQQEETQPEQPEETQPEQQEETQPEQPEETQPEQQEETQPEQPEETQPEQQEETQPEQPEETQPEQQEETQPEQPEETQPEQQEETQPEQPEETQPEQQEETQPEQPEETQPEQQEETQPEQPEETQPEQQEETQPEVVPEQKEEKVPTLNEILKQIKDIFGKN